MKTKALVLVISLCLSAGSFAAELNVYAAASLIDAMKEIGVACKSSDCGHR